ncbi:cysteate synthase [candidate division WOR-3 bacterium]|nr:cysteate synthase [candidate division WOR-3 bacterium]
MSFKPTTYTLKCVHCGKVYTEDNHRLGCDEDHKPAFVRAQYGSRQLTVREGAEGMFRFGDWLPLCRPVKNTGYPVAYKSEGLAARLGLSDLWISFSGYWPERGADMRTCTFKELEAPPVLSRFTDDSRTVVVASAGNTARAFAEICSANDIPLLLVVNEVGFSNLWSTRPFSEKVRLVGVVGGADYFDAISLSGMIASLPGYVPEGGAKNVARRDGMGISVLAAVTEAGRIPDHYFQAVGSGTGGVSAWEAVQRLRADGRFGDVNMKLHLVQNHPFTPMTDAWTRRSRSLPQMTDDEARSLIAQINAFVLSNRRPPYAVVGGVFDALTETEGVMYSVTNQEAESAGKLFEDTEGIDLTPAAKVAVASLKQAVDKGLVQVDDMILLNITGGGEKRLFSEHKINYLKPHIEVKRSEISEETVKKIFA